MPAYENFLFDRRSKIVPKTRMSVNSEPIRKIIHSRRSNYFDVSDSIDSLIVDTIIELIELRL